MIEAIILAAGESKRMGRPKPLLHIGGKSALALIVDTLKKAGISSNHVVVGHKAKKIIDEAGIDADFVFNENYMEGQFSSLRKGVVSLSKECSAVIVCLVDQPHIHSNWVRHLIKEKSKNEAWIIRLKFGGKSGHPLLISKELFKEIMAMSSKATAKDLMIKYKDRTAFIESDSDGILYDADTPADFEFIQRYMTKKASEGFPPDA
jgi:molybdenum cofactor cytidylyltransferase